MDALVVAYKVPLDAIAFGALVAAHRGATSLGVSRVEHVVGNTPFALGSMLARGAHRLTNADMDVLVGLDEHDWTVEVTARALALATHGLDRVIERSRQTALAFDDSLGAFFEDRGTEQPTEVVSRVRRLDLCADFAGLVILPSEVDAFVSRSKKRGEYRTRIYRDESNAVTGYTFSEGGPIMARIYDKTRELLGVHGIDSEKYRTEAAGWKAAGWDGRSPVWRVEFQARREALESLGVRGANDLPPSRLSAMWRYFTEQWLRLVDTRTDTRRARCATDERWRVVQQSAHWGDAGDVLVRQHGRRSGATTAQAAGTMLSVLAANGDLAEVTTIDEAVEKYRRALVREFDAQRFTALAAGYRGRFAQSCWR